LYDQGTDLSLEKAIEILSLKETSRLELQESKSATIDAIRYKRCGYCNLEHPQDKRFCPAAKHTCEKSRKTEHYAIVFPSSKRAQVNQVTHTNLPQHRPIKARNEKEPLESGWHINLQSGDEKRTWCLDTGAQASCQQLIGTYSEQESQLKTVGYVEMPLKLGQNLVKKEKVYFARGTPNLLLGIPAIRHLGLIHDIPGKYAIKAIEEKVSPPPLRSKEDVLKAYPKLFIRLGS